MLGLSQEVEHTVSRRSGPRRWLRAVVWVVAADLHPRAGATTLRVAEDLAARMDYDTGHVRYCLDEVGARLGIDRSTVKRHIAVLRELGLLAWVEHGTRTNVRRLLGMTGYAGTATVYAAVIPPVYDQAMGNQLVGAGYGARVVVDQRGAGLVDNQPAAVAPCAPPSLSVVKESGKAEVESGFKNTSRERASRPTASLSSTSRSEKRSREGGAGRRPPAQVARDCWIAAQVRPRVAWTQREGIRRLAYALRPLIDQGMDAHTIVAELHSWLLLWRPARAAAYIRAHLTEQAAQVAARAAAAHPMDNPEWRAALAATEQRRADEAPAGTRPRTDDDRRTARAAACADLALVTDHLDEHDFDDTLDLYGLRLTSLAERLTASGNAAFTARW